MKITIEFDCDNAAFEDDFFVEVREVLRQAETKIHKQRRRPPSLCEHLESADKLYDKNGNSVGTVRVEP